MDIYSIIQREDNYEGMEIRAILQCASQLNGVIFMQNWIQTLLTLFKNKQQVISFTSLFCQIANLNISSLVPEQCLTVNQTDFSIDIQSIIGMQDIGELLKMETQLSQSIIKNESQIAFYQWSLPIENILVSDPYLSEQEISQKLTQSNDKAPSTVQVQKILISLRYRKQNLHKLPIDRNSIESIQNRYKFCLEYYKLSKLQGKIFFIDSFIYDNNSCRELIWRKLWQPFVQRIQNEHIKLLATIQTGQFYWQISQQTNINDSLSIYNILSAISENNKGININIIISSNICINNQIKRILMNNKWRLFMLPPFSPQLNPLNTLFTQFKQKIRQNQIEDLTRVKEYLQDYCLKLNPIVYFDTLNQHIINGLARSMID